jgi:hypothetical protein
MAPALALHAGDTLPVNTTGKVLVLENERTLEGDIERVGEQFRVRRALGELWLQRESVLRLCKDYPEAYRYLVSRANLRDPDEHLRLARWCQGHGLREEALTEVNQAAELRPNHGETQRLLRSLQRADLLTRSGKMAPSAEDSEPTTTPPPVTTESLSGFVTRVQPLLMNACASCHATGKGGNFKLTRTFENSFTNRRITLQNLAAVLVRINGDHIETSPLLIKAVSIHGDMAQPALQGREAATYRTLDDWVRLTVANSPQLREQHAQPAEITRTPAAPLREPSTESFAAARAPKLESTAPTTLTPPSTRLGGESKEVGQSTPLKQAADPVDLFDPLIFNRQLHPDRVPEKERPN